MIGSRPFSLSLSLCIVEAALIGGVMTSIAARSAAQQQAVSPPTVEEAVNDLFTNDPALQTPSGVWSPNFTGQPPVPEPEDVFAANSGLMLTHSEVPMGDLDGDGIDDFYLAAMGSPEAGAETQGRLIAYSGWTGATLFEYTNAEFGDGFSMAVTHMQDVSGDGGDDLLIGAPFSSAGAVEAGQVSILNGADGRTLYTITSPVVDATLGLTVASAGDMNNDGLGDAVVAAPFDGAGKVYVFLSGSGLPTPASEGVAPNGFYPRALTVADADFVFVGEVAVQSYGLALAGVGDVDGDGRDDIAVGAPHYDDPTMGEADNRGRVYFYSGADGSLIGTITGHEPLQSVGFSIASAGDMNHDGRADVLVGAPGEQDARGAVYLFLSPGGAVPWTRDTSAPDWRLVESASTSPLPDQMFGMVTVDGNDMDGDGARDWVVQSLAPTEEDPTRARLRTTVYSGATAGYLYDFFVEEIAPPPPPPLPPGGDRVGDPAQLGVVVSNFGMQGATAAQGDLNADTRVGAPDLIIAIENTFAAPVQAGGTRTGIDCTSVIPLVDETGNPVDPPCQDTSGGGPTGGGNPDPSPSSFFDDCETLWANPNNPPDNPFDCIMMALCVAHNEAGGLGDTMNAINADKGVAQAAYDDAMAAVKAAALAAVNAAQGARAQQMTATHKAASDRITTRRNIYIAGGAIAAGTIAVTGPVIVEEVLTAPTFKAGTAGVVKAVKGEGGFGWKTVVGGVTKVVTGAVVGFSTDLSNWLVGKSVVDQSVANQNAAYVSATAGPLAAFNAQNDISLPALQAACGLAAQRRADAHQAYHDRVVELDQQCRDGLSGLQP